MMREGQSAQSVAQRRVQVLSVPHALTPFDVPTLGGRPLSVWLSMAGRVLPAGVWRRVSAALTVLLLFAAPRAVAEQPITVLHSFAGGTDGAGPVAAVMIGTDGDFYGTTQAGGASNLGTVFKMTPSGGVTILHTFTGAGDGASPRAALIQATDGNFYGTTSAGGAFNGGTVFRMTPAGAVTILHSFPIVTFPLTPTDGYGPVAPLIQATDGNFYGTTVFGGTNSSGVVYRITTGGAYAVVHSFGGLDASNVREGQQSRAALVQATDGNFYGTTTVYGGPTQLGQGTVFRMTPNGTTTTLHVFLGGTGDGLAPAGALLQAADGALYGTTQGGGGAGIGTIFKLTMAGAYTLLHSFQSSSFFGEDGAYPLAGLIQGQDGLLYGTTSSGGLHSGGEVFAATLSGNLTVLYSFGGFPGGELPEAPLIQAADGRFYGTTMAGGSGSFSGVVFEFGHLPDLTVSDVTFAPTISTAGGSISISDVTSNSGTGSAAPSSTGYLLSTTPSLTLTGQFIGNRSVPLLVPTDTNGGTVVVALPAFMQSGSYYIKACADRTSVVDEADETNNCRNAATPITITTNLAMTSVSVTPTASIPNGTLTVTDLVKNTTTNTTSNQSTNRYYLDVVPTTTAASILLSGSRNVSSLSPGSSSSGTTALRVPLMTPRGDYYVIACADDLHVVPESDETDNCKATTDTVLIEAPAAYDVVNQSSKTYVVRADSSVDLGAIDRAAASGTLERRFGAATDGVTVLLLRVRTSVNVTFKVTPGGADGMLLDVNGPISATNTSGVVSAAPRGGSVWALYRSPGQFNAPALQSRDVVITVTPSGGDDYPLTLTLERPPVVLIHGAWDNPSAWTQPPIPFDQSLQLAGFRTYLANYEDFNAASWDPSNYPNGAVQALESTIKDALRQTRARSIAATQANVVGHSTGGLVTRALIRQPPCGPVGPLTPWGDFQCSLDPSNLYQGWVRLLITIGTPHNGAPIAKFLFEHADEPVFLPGVGSLPLKMVMFDVGRPIDGGLVEDFVPGSPAFTHLGTTCDDTPIRGRGTTVPVRGYGIVGDHEPVHSPSWLNFFDMLTLYTIHQTVDDYIGEENDVMSGLASQWGRGAARSNIPKFDSTVHSPSYTVFGLAGSVVAELGSASIQTKVANLLDLATDDPTFDCFQSAAPSQTRAARPASRPRLAQPSTVPNAPTIRFTSPAAGATIPQATGSTVTLTIASTDGAVPQQLMFVVGNAMSVPGPAAPPFTVSFNVPPGLPLGPLNVLAIAIDAVTGSLLTDVVSITITPSRAPTALLVDPSRLVFSSKSQPTRRLRVLASFDRGGGSTAQFDVSASALGSTYGTLHGDTVIHVDADGRITPVGAGSDSIQVNYGGLSALVPVTVQGPAAFTDSILSPGTNVIRAVHLQELRARVALLRQGAGLSPFNWQDPALTAGATIVRAQHILDLRTALAEVYNAIGLTPPVFTDSAVTGTPIKAIHIAELRAAVAALE